ncbi:hypothetical protein BDQ12DRAFT_732150 [Crucibulum laeve]|uniref:Chromo domain-containing protein n=1 Tax=Crucibulum laeve TaxID=68775 RepID=A0A5C3MAL1_9AGAR|nr:hypothetical protein BDQ12DRAFT_732150 [Crucibulum laeve]
MSSNEEEEEYEVESVSEAIVVKATPKIKRKHWSYRVRWKGYGADADTYEPKESFVGSEDILKRFWEGVDTGGRDHENIKLFQLGEVLRRMGPPRRKKRKSSTNASNVSLAPALEPSDAETSGHGQGSGSAKRKHAESAGDEGDRTLKRIRGQASDPIPVSSCSPENPLHRAAPTQSSKGLPQSLEPPSPTKATKASSSSANARQRKKRRTPSEIIPDSDEDNEMPIQLPEEPIQVNIVETPADDSEGFDPLFDEDPSKLPFHRDRLVNPRVKLVDDTNPAAMAGVIPAKARAVGRIATEASSSQPSGSSPIRDLRQLSGSKTQKKNKSSLLTFNKGGIKIIKGKYHKSTEEESAHTKITTSMDIRQSQDEGPVIPPSAGELLELAGLDSDAGKALSDFEDDAEAPPKPTVVPGAQAQQGAAPERASESPQSNSNASLQQSISVAKDQLFPTALSSSVSQTTRIVWKRPTIFGPLGSGSDSNFKNLPSLAVSSPDSAQSFSLSLNLDSSVSVPVMLTDVAAASKGKIVGGSGPPGKFYSAEHAQALISTLRTGGPSAHVQIVGHASDENKRHWEHFSARLHRGDLFLAVAGSELLSLCSSSNDLVCQRLNIPANLLAIREQVLMTRVEMENYSLYAEIATKADETRWGHYVEEREKAV